MANHRCAFLFVEATRNNRGGVITVRRPPRFDVPPAPSVLGVAAVAAAASATTRPISRRALLGLGLFTKGSTR